MAFKMKGNPYKLGKMATKSTMKMAKKAAMKMKPMGDVDTPMDLKKDPMMMKKESSAMKQAEQGDFEPAYEGGDYSFKDLQKMSKTQLVKKFGENAAKNIEKDLIEKGYKLKAGEQGPVKYKKKKKCQGNTLNQVINQKIKPK